MTHSARSIVVGLGRTGLSCARYLHARHESFAVTDNRAAPPESAALQQLSPATEVAFGGFDERLLEGAGEIVVSPGVSLREPFLLAAAARGVPARRRWVACSDGSPDRSRQGVFTGSTLDLPTTTGQCGDESPRFTRYSD